MKRIAPLFLLALAAAPAALPAQQVPERFENLKVLPANIHRDTLVQIMRAFAQGLGVRCTYCHVERPGQEQLDFASDDKVTKEQARFMMRMTRDVNARVSELPDRNNPPVRVFCVTCHRGSPLPKTIDVVLAEAIDSAGVQGAVQRYRQLREETMERGRYDFGEGPVNDLARRLAAQGKTAEAAALLEMNAELHPTSAAIDLQLGDVYRARGDRDRAIARYRAALEKQPNNQMARRRLDELTGQARP
ncbi:MAG TPA: c-type cytochrome [Longimicrobiaceae bacterium]|nr:c-type cytochrome [Longimicrobiaceae bacterium]